MKVVALLICSSLRLPRCRRMAARIRFGLFVFLLAAPFSWAGDVFKGADVYRDHCRGCHGASGRGEVGNTPDFTLGEGLLQSDMALMQAIAVGKGVMPGYRGVLSDEDILDVISYIRSGL